jgi:hypothetical protein
VPGCTHGIRGKGLRYAGALVMVTQDDPNSPDALAVGKMYLQKYRKTKHVPTLAIAAEMFLQAGDLHLYRIAMWRAILAYESKGDRFRSTIMRGDLTKRGLPQPPAPLRTHMSKYIWPGPETLDPTRCFFCRSEGELRAHLGAAVCRRCVRFVARRTKAEFSKGKRLRRDDLRCSNCGLEGRNVHAGALGAQGLMCQKCIGAFARLWPPRKRHDTKHTSGGRRT